MKPLTTLALAAVLTALPYHLGRAEPFAPTKAQIVAMGEALDALCPPLVNEAFELEVIAREKANPSGVVDLRVLHEAGDMITQDRAEIKAARRDHAAGLKIAAKVIRKAPDLGFCQSYEEAKEESQ